MRDCDRSSGAVDLGCGAGEILTHLASLVRVDLALDVSPTLVEVARLRLGETGPPVELADAMTALPGLSSATWMTSGALNQYLDRIRLEALVSSFLANDRVQALYAFDTVDPWRYFALPGRSKFYETRKPSLRSLGARVGGLLRLGARRDVIRLGGSSMGYGVFPSFWREVARRSDLEVRFAGSAEYEYRYHVALEKP